MSESAKAANHRQEEERRAKWPLTNLHPTFSQDSGGRWGWVFGMSGYATEAEARYSFATLRKHADDDARIGCPEEQRTQE